ncbi:MAG: glycerol-3-phosphate 1-O-acyltransferase PlsY [Betaproteobacteria bacterium]|nr:glycerol-3-phosphate 1-O-acyltransferase PlsY [Betaproteobacteria bacterium]
MLTSVFILLAYLIGSLSFAVIVSRAFRLPDPHTYGSGNPGATNVLRSGRKAAAALTLLGDGAKGWVAVFLAQHLGPDFAVDAEGIAGVALAVFVGHLYPLYFGFRGGKGVATALGVLLAINPWLGLGTLATWMVIAFSLRISSLAAIIAAAFAPLYDLWLSGPRLITAALAVISVLLVLRHRANIQRLLRGEEGRI